MASVVLDSQSIVLVKVESANAGTWTDAPRKERVRSVALELRAEQVVRGAVARGAKARVSVEQREATGRFHAVAGPWSNVTLESGRKLVVFSSSSQKSLAALLAKEAVLRVGAEQESVDAAVILDLEKSAAKPSAWGTKVTATQRKAIGVLFAEYLAHKLPDVAKAGDAEWAAVLKFLEDPANSATLRRQGGEAAVNAVLMHAPAPGDLAPVTTRFLFRMLANESDTGFAQRALESWIPNLTGMAGSEKKRGPSAIFANAAQTKAAQATVEKLAASPSRDRVLAWFRE